MGKIGCFYSLKLFQRTIYTKCLRAARWPNKRQSSCIHSHCPVVVVCVLCIIFNSSFGGFLCTKHCSSVRLLLAEHFTFTWATGDPYRRKYSSHQARKMGSKAVRGPLSNWYGANRVFLSQAFFLISDCGICGISVVVVWSCFSRRVGWCSSFWCNLS